MTEDKLPRLTSDALERERLLQDIRTLQGPDAAAQFSDFPLVALRVHAEWLRKGAPLTRQEREEIMERDRLLVDLMELEGPHAVKIFAEMPLVALRRHVEWLRRGKPMGAANGMQPRGYGWSVDWDNSG